MAAISSSDVSYSVDARNGVISDKDKRYSANISFGDGVLTYPAGGIPLDKGLLGFRSELKDLVLVDASSGDGYVYKFDKSNQKIRIYEAEYTAMADGPLVELGALATPAATTLKAIVYGD
jgi:hypothetical protein